MIQQFINIHRGKAIKRFVLGLNAVFVYFVYLLRLNGT